MFFMHHIRMQSVHRLDYLRWTNSSHSPRDQKKKATKKIGKKRVMDKNQRMRLAVMAWIGKAGSFAARYMEQFVTC